MFRPTTIAERHYGANALKALFAAALHLLVSLIIPPFEFIPYRMGHDPLLFEPALQGAVPVQATMRAPHTFSLR